ncbi:MAG TPA: ATP-binding protein [Minicystis sp.]|nr:ATP-binding protein [Minicystis sp.]
MTEDGDGGYSEEPTAVLLVDDHEENLTALEAILRPLPLRIVTAASGALALKALLRETFAVVLLDVAMPEMDGFETASIIKQRDRTRHTPIIFMTAGATGDVSAALQGYQVGAVDYLIKPVDPEIVRAKVGVFVELHRRGERIRRQAEQLREAERKMRERELEELRRAVERRYQNLADSVPQLVLRARPSGDVEYANHRWIAYTGQRFDDAAGGGWARALHPNDAEPFLARLRRALDPGEPFRVECRVRGELGGYRWFLSEGVPERGAGATPLGALVSFTDVTDQKRAEEERAVLHEREHAARLELEASIRRSDLVAEVGHLLSQSLDPGEVLRRFAAIMVERLASWCIVDRVTPGSDDFEQVAFAHASPELAALGADLARGAVVPELASVLRTGRAEVHASTDAERLARAIGTSRADLVERLGAVSFVAAPLRARGEIIGAMVFVSARPERVYGPADAALAVDLAHRAALSIDNARLYAEAQEAIRVREEFLSIASHELRTPLSALQLQIQSIDVTLKRPEFDVGRLAGKLTIAQRQVDRLTRLIGELLDVSRIQAGRLELDVERADLAEVVRDVAARFAGEIERSGTPLEVSAPEPVVGWFDRLRLDQVATNLLHNALKYGRGELVRVEVRGQDGVAQMSFTDRGIGISNVDLSRIFGRFERAVSSRSYGGMGIGLYIVDQIVRAHGGAVRVASELGHGSTFTVELPLERHAAPPSPDAGHGRPSPQGAESAPTLPSGWEAGGRHV